VVRREPDRLPFIAEDLGPITPELARSAAYSDCREREPHQFAFDGSRDNPHLPCNYTPNTVVYAGTDDNPTSRGWFFIRLPVAARCNEDRKPDFSRT
jgi:4-alpha-glucanotransferase